MLRPIPRGLPRRVFDRAFPPEHSGLARAAVVKVVALVVCATVGLLAVRPAFTEAQSRALATTYGFSRAALNSTPPNARYDRVVQPGLAHIQRWISAVGASVALVDLGRADRAVDACVTDPRDDTVRLMPVPGAGGAAYASFALPMGSVAWNATMAPMGCVPADLDEDGDTDLLAYYWGRSPVVFLNRGLSGSVPTAAQFTATELVSPMQIWNTTAANVADLDGDGHLDLWIGNYFPDGAKVLDPTAVNDTRMAMQQSMGLARNAGVNRIYLTQPTGRADTLPELSDQSTAVPDDAARSWTLAIGLQDLTGDQRPEVYQANDFGPDQLLVNHSLPGRLSFTEVRGDRTLTDPKSTVLGHDSFKGMGVAFSYAPGAELPSIMVSNIADEYALQESNLFFTPTGSGAELLGGKLPYREDSEELGLARAGWAWDVKAVDLDNDGGDEFVQATGFALGTTKRWAQLQELAMGNDQLLQYPRSWPNFGPGDDLSGADDHNHLWARSDQGRYDDLSAEVGLDLSRISRGYAAGDVNGDNRLDLLEANQWSDSTVLINTSTATQPAADLALVVPGAAGGLTPAIGAAVQVSGAGLPEQRTQLYPANGHAGVSAPAVHLLAPAGGDERTATVSWIDRSGAAHRQSFPVRAGHHRVILNNDGTVTD